MSSFHLVATLAIIIATIGSYAWEKVSLEVTSLVSIIAFLLLFHFFPMLGDDGGKLVTEKQLLSGFAEPALFTVLGLMVMAQGLVQTGALEGATNWMLEKAGSKPNTVITISLLTVMIVSAFLNNTPVVVIFMPILAAIAERTHGTPSHVMMPLAFCATLGGNMTLIGSSTNLLVAGSYHNITGNDLGFFDITVPGMAIAITGFIYLLIATPRILPKRMGLTESLRDKAGKQFIVELVVSKGSQLDGQTARAGMFPGLHNMTISLVIKDGEEFRPPYDDITLATGDTVVLAATRQAVTEMLAKSPKILHSILNDDWDSSKAKSVTATGHHLLAEVLVAPASRLDGRTLQQIAFKQQTGCTIIGVERRSRMIRGSLSDFRVAPGDVLLVMGPRERILDLGRERDVVLLDRSATDFQSSSQGRYALLIFAGTIISLSSEVVSPVVTAMSAATLMILTGCLNIRQAARAIDRKLILLIGSSLAMGTAMEKTGTAEFLASNVAGTLDGAPIILILMGYTMLMTVITNILSNNATGLIFTPIGVALAAQLGVDPMPFVIATIIGANNDFATPIGYQVNLLVMGPGRYRFADYLKLGGGLTLVMWATFAIVAAWYYNLV